MPLSPKSHETKTVLDALGSFRADLAASQKQVLRKLDDELHRIKNAPFASPAAPFIPSDLLATDIEEPSLTIPTTVQAGLSSPAPAWGSAKAETYPEKVLPGMVELERVDSAPIHTFASLPNVAQERKKNLPWIHKHESRGSRKISTSEDPDEGRVFSHLNAAHATDLVRKAAIETFESPKTRSNGSSCSERINRHPFFERLSLFMIYLNAVWIAVDIEFNDSAVVFEAAPIFVVVEVVFLIFFSSEAMIRFMSHINCKRALRDSWLLFDFLLVIFMVLETWLVPAVALLLEGTGGGSSAVGRSATVLRVARILRVLRTARIVRVARYMPELMILVKGLLVAARSVFFTMVLLLLITYVFSIAFMQLSLADEQSQLQEFFPTMPQSVLTLIVYCIMPDQKEFFDRVSGSNGENWFMGALVIVYVLVGSLIVMNMLVGILVEAVQTVATMEHEQIHVDFAKKVLWEMMTEGNADQDGDNRISEDEFVRLLERPEASVALMRLGVDTYAAMEYGQLLFEDGQPLTFGEFMDAILTLRGSNQTTVKDVVNLRKFTADEFSTLHAVLNDLCHFLAGRGMTTGFARRLSTHSRSRVRHFDEC
ncbi:Sodium channel protein 1 brain [Symbiodinium microadriaticum]|uniref:Sodium channel protein 1 brain n=1 Tax=Symbiodinium microadriaticum TaxID=2951 RepID=A0A1Q9D8I4_SYMMI|nr:Sodium channel protein 1 brain [Symbiodinium microadriaticum]